MRDVKATWIRVKLLTGTYPLQQRTSKIYPNISSICPYCKTGIEDTSHFLLNCPKFEYCRARHLDRLISALSNIDIEYPDNDDSRVHLILNGPLGKLTRAQQAHRSRLCDIHKQCTALTFSLHLLREKYNNLHQRWWWSHFHKGWSSKFKFKFKCGVCMCGWR